MTEPGFTEQGGIDNSYASLAEKYPVDKTLVTGPSFPDWEVNDEERKWAESFLSTGDNSQVLENFGNYVGIVGKKGLQLLRDSSVRLTNTLEDKLKQNISQDVLTDFLRSKFQTDTLFFEEGLRGARDIDNRYWNDEEDGQLDSARKGVKKSKAAFRDINDFVQNKTNKLSSVRVFAESKYKAQENAAISNENYFRQNPDSNASYAKDVLDQHSKDAIFWSSVSSFLDNLELSRSGV